MSGWKEKLKNLPKKPGVYLFKDARGEVLYVGKAKNLKNRVRSYFLKTAELPHPRQQLMLAQIADLDYVIVSSEVESLILENNFIKKYRPRFNIRLRDDKNYQFIKIDYSTEIPQIYPVRKITPSSSPPISSAPGGRTGGESVGIVKYFGPYTSGTAVKQTLKLLNRVFHLCRNKKVGSRPCFAYHLGHCPGICIGKISLVTYSQSFKAIEQFLANRQGEIIRNLTFRMQKAAKAKKFETAAQVRDQIRSLKLIWEKQKIISPQKVSEDYFSIFSSNNLAVVNLFIVRDGKLIHQEIFEVLETKDLNPNQILNSFLKQYYAEAQDIPQAVVIKYQIPDKKNLEKWLHVKIIIARRGKKLQLLKLGEENGEDYYQKNYLSQEALLLELQRFLSLPKLPRRIEAYDISNLQGFAPVGSMVVFRDGKPAKSEYRKFLIRGSSPDQVNLKATPNDVAMMREMLIRRFARAQIGSKFSPFLPTGGLYDGRSPAGRQTIWPLPDLIIIDGGKGQLNAALAALRISNSEFLISKRFQIIGLAKRLEEIFLPGEKKSIILRGDSPILFLLQRIRDEAHRFAITFFRRRYQKTQVQSRLDDIFGVGPETRKKMIAKFCSISGIRQASLEALAKIVGTKKAKIIKEQL